MYFCGVEVQHEVMKPGHRSALSVLRMGLTADKRVYAFPGELKVLYGGNETSG